MTDIYEWRIGITYTRKTRCSSSGHFQGSTIDEAIVAAKAMAPVGAEDIDFWLVERLGLAEADNVDRMERQHW